MSNKESKTVESNLLFEIVCRRYGDRLSKEELNQVLEGVESIVKISEALRAVKLENNVEPFSIFKPYRKEVFEHD